MASRIEQYALIGDTQTGALVADDGSLDWCCVPRFDSGACFAALLGDEQQRLVVDPPRAATADGARATRRRYRDGTLVLETEWDTAEGTVRVIDFMPIRDRSVDLVRIVEGVSGRVAMELELRVRFDYGSIVPWVRRHGDALHMIAGPDALRITSPVELTGADLAHRRRVQRGRGRAGAVRAHLVPVAPRRSAARGATPIARSPAPPPSGRSGRRAPTATATGPTSCGARSSRSRRSPTRPPAASSPPPPRRCPSGRAGCATGTTATAGCATPRSRSTR